MGHLYTIYLSGSGWIILFSTILHYDYYYSTLHLCDVHWRNICNANAAHIMTMIMYYILLLAWYYQSGSRNSAAITYGQAPVLKGILYCLCVVNVCKCRKNKTCDTVAFLCIAVALFVIIIHVFAYLPPLLPVWIFPSCSISLSKAICIFVLYSYVCVCVDAAVILNIVWRW